MGADRKKEGEFKNLAFYNKIKCRLCRKEGVKLFLKGERCLSPSCPLEKKGAVPPGQHGLKRKRKISDFGLRLREKQKAKRTYGILERQFRCYFREAKKKGATQTFLTLLERRLDNVIYRLGFSPSRAMARQLISHGHVLVNNKKVDIHSYRVRKEEIISLDKKSQEMAIVQKLLADKKYRPPSWLERKGAVGKILRLPAKEDIEADINEQLIVEYYSR